MKKTGPITIAILCFISWSCENKRTRGRVYMPDMYYSRAYETYSSTDKLREQGIHYDGKPVPGTIKRGELFSFPISKDRTGDSTNYRMARQVQNPLPALDAIQMQEAERLYLVNCGICHGSKLDGNGPLYNGGSGPYAAAPRNLASDPVSTTMPDGQMFYSITYGKGQMGSYASQLTTTQRWMVIHFIKAKQGEASGASTAAGGTATSDTATQK